MVQAGLFSVLKELEEYLATGCLFWCKAIQEHSIRMSASDTQLQALFSVLGERL